MRTRRVCRQRAKANDLRLIARSDYANSAVLGKGVPG